jgi:hypothetical protein
MRQQLRLVAVALLGLAVAACSSSDGSGGSAGTGGVAGTGGAAGTGGTAGTGGAAGTGGTAGTGGSGTSTVSGVVYTRDFAENPVSGATVSVVDTQISTTTDQVGQFTLENVPNGAQFFVTEAAGSWGIVDYWDVPDETQSGADLGVVPDADIEALAQELGRSISTSDGALDVFFYEGAAGGETASITAASDAPFTFNLAGAPVEQAGVIVDNDGFGDLIYLSVDPGDGPVGATVAGVPGTTVCAVDEDPGTTYPIIAKSITIVYAYCEPAQ